MAAEADDPDDPDDALDRLWAQFFAVRAQVDDGRITPTAARRRWRTLHAAAGRTGSAHVPVFRAEVRGEIARLNAAAAGPDAAAGRS